MTIVDSLGKRWLCKIVRGPSSVIYTRTEHSVLRTVYESVRGLHSTEDVDAYTSVVRTEYAYGVLRTEQCNPYSVHYGARITARLV